MQWHSKMIYIASTIPKHILLCPWIFHCIFSEKLLIFIL
uniref:Uncharacterized protein n=1 Tax=Anguilla anguilla TaxID=7936 RepID=A0A0E9TF60_ANGAN